MSMETEERSARIAEAEDYVSMENRKGIANIALHATIVNTASGEHTALIAEGVDFVSMESVKHTVRFAEVELLVSMVEKIFARFAGGIEFVIMVNLSISA